MAARFLNDKTLAATARCLETAADLSLAPATLAAMELVLSEETLARCGQVRNDIRYPMGWAPSGYGPAGHMSGNNVSRATICSFTAARLFCAQQVVIYLC
jgi:hypothetical protein